MALRKKITLFLVAVVAGYFLLSYSILEAVVAPTFSALEKSGADSDRIRVEQAIRNDLEKLSTSNKDWSDWDDAHNFVQGNNDSFVKINLNETTLTNLDVDLMLFFDTRGKLVWGQLVDPRTRQSVPLSGVPQRIFSPEDPLLRHSSLESVIDGLLQTRSGPMQVSSQPILTTGSNGPIGGTLIFGHYLDVSRFAALRTRTEVAFEAFTAGEIMSPEVGAVFEQLSGSPEGTLLEQGEGDLFSYRMLYDVYGEPALLLQVRTPREVTALGSDTIRVALGFLLLAGMTFMGVIWLLLQRLIIGPLSTLTDHILHIRQSGDLSKSLGFQRGDEIGTLAAEFDSLTGELRSTRRQLLEQSFMAGMAETAAGVLHNIRNAMTPLVNRLSRASRAISGVRASRISQAVGELGDTTTAADRRTKLADYTGLALQQMGEGHEAALNDLGVASRQAAQVEKILAEQERFAHVEPVIEALALEEVVGEAMTVLPSPDTHQLAVLVDDSISSQEVLAHRLGLVQVLSNVLVNATESVERANRNDGAIALSANRETVDNRDMIRLRVTDNGEGIDGAALTKIFQKGHTSKPAGKGGLGLHWCANTLGSMGGKLHAESEGRGSGAEFHILLPAA